MDFLKASLLLPLLPLFVVPIALVVAAWLDRGRHARRTGGAARRPPA